MKITETQPKAPIRAADRVESTPDKPSAGPVQDRVSLEGAGAVSRAIDAARATASSTRQAHLERLEAAVRNGSYQPNAQQIADRILQAAALDAQVRAIFQK